uniref:Putative nuclease HARBI1 n=1 Tax=Geotrypetes seraphini TaxID=260995 RepID=A0A6P8QNK1_GEOSA|nr:putative nuclease HARBI1 [Geotrypetes seraphini]
MTGPNIECTIGGSLGGAPVSLSSLTSSVWSDTDSTRQPLLQAPSRRNYPMPVHLKVTTALVFLATGSFQSVLASSSGLTQPAISNCLTQFLNAFLTHTHDYISFPTTLQALQDSMRRFYNVAQFPSVIGVVDCTHIALRPPRADEASYRNRKAFHSMNMQVVCNSEGEILDVCARYPGSTHDSYIVQHCGLHRRATQGEFNGAWLLGDRGNPQRVWLMTPIVHPHTAAEEEYNRHHRATRSIIERTFGQLKNRFRCLDCSGDQLLYRPEKVAHIFVACCMLHNLAVRKQQPLPDPPQQQPDADDDEPPPPPHRRAQQSAVHEGFNARHRLIQTHFV